MRSFVVKRALYTVNNTKLPHTFYILFPFNKNRRWSIEGVVPSWPSTVSPWFWMNMRSEQAETRRGMWDSPLHSYQPEPVNGFRAFVAHGAGNKCPGGWGNAKPAVYSGLQAHTISQLRSIRQSRTRHPVSPAAAEWYLLTLSWYFPDTFRLLSKTLSTCLSGGSKCKKIIGWYFDTFF